MNQNAIGRPLVCGPLSPMRPLVFNYYVNIKINMLFFTYIGKLWAFTNQFSLTLGEKSVGSSKLWAFTKN